MMMHQSIQTKGEFFSTGYNEELDDLRKLTTEVKSAIAEMEEKQKEETGITSLKIKHNRVFGYFLEVTAANKDKVPQNLDSQTNFGKCRTFHHS